MLASQHFKIRRTKQDDWFDPILNADTKLFVDPFMVFKDKDEEWRRSHDEIIGHFDRAFQLIAEGNLNPTSLAYRKALDLLLFTEPRELCLGYTSQGTAGLGSGRKYAALIAEAIVQAIRRGLQHPRHFEELGILNEGIGADRISDATCTILKRRLVAYTQDIAKRHNLHLEAHRLYAGSFDEQRQRWTTPEVMLPTNPSSDGPLLLVPERFLRDLPVLNADDWWDSYENHKLREDLNYEVMTNVDKPTIVAAARDNPELVRQWAEAKEKEKHNPYDFHGDPNGVWQWDRATLQYIESHPLKLVASKTDKEFSDVIEKVIKQFKQFVEEQGGWDLLWRNTRTNEKPEHAAQLLFRGITQHYCTANNISLDPEVNLGRGPVDFKFSSGYKKRAHLEVKKLHNGKFWHGLEVQLPSYMKSDQVTDGWYVAIQYRSGKSADERIRALPKRVATISKDKGLNLRFGVIDARPKASASKLDK